jgi:hypothetical protein
MPRGTPREITPPRVENKILAVVGMRRAGKTYFLYQLIHDLLGSGVPSESVLYINLEDDRLLPVDHRKLAGLLEGFYALHPANHERRVHLFLDEIQVADGWPAVLRRFLDTRDVQITITGSSSKLLSTEIATALRGRSLDCEVAPFSFSERLTHLGRGLPRNSAGPAERDRLREELERHITCGGFPETILLPTRERIQTLQGYVNVVILRDLVERHGIANVALVRHLLRTLISTAGGRFTVNKFYNDSRSQGLRVAKNTLHDYLEMIEDAFLTFLVPIHTLSARKRNVNPRKVYAVDPGLVGAYTLRRDNFGPLFENLVYNDLRRRGCRLAYHLTRSGREVDFVAQYPDGRVRLYQATHDITEEATRQREQAALDEACAELGAEGMLVTPESYVEGFLAAGS